MALPLRLRGFYRPPQGRPKNRKRRAVYDCGKNSIDIDFRLEMKYREQKKARMLINIIKKNKKILIGLKKNIN